MFSHILKKFRKEKLKNLGLNAKALYHENKILIASKATESPTIEDQPQSNRYIVVKNTAPQIVLKRTIPKPYMNRPKN